MHLEVIILRFLLAIFSLEKPMFFEEKRDVLLLPEPTEPGVKDLAEGPPQRGAKRVFTHGAVLAVVALACGKVRCTVPQLSMGYRFSSSTRFVTGGVGLWVRGWRGRAQGEAIR